MTEDREKALNGIVDMTAMIAEAAVGMRNRLISGGFDSDAATSMAYHFHAHLMHMIMRRND